MKLKPSHVAAPNGHTGFLVCGIGPRLVEPISSLRPSRAKKLPKGNENNMEAQMKQYVVFDLAGEVLGVLDRPEALWPNGNPRVKSIRTGRRMAAHELLEQIEKEITAKRCGDPVTTSL
jgi:hypothetical protein